MTELEDGRRRKVEDLVFGADFARDMDASNGCEFNGDGVLKTLFFVNDFPGQPTVKRLLRVEFHPGTDHIKSANLDGVEMEPGMRGSWREG